MRNRIRLIQGVHSAALRVPAGIQRPASGKPIALLRNLGSPSVFESGAWKDRARFSGGRDPWPDVRLPEVALR